MHVGRVRLSAGFFLSRHGVGTDHKELLPATCAQGNQVPWPGGFLAANHYPWLSPSERRERAKQSSTHSLSLHTACNVRQCPSQPSPRLLHLLFVLSESARIGSGAVLLGSDTAARHWLWFISCQHASNGPSHVSCQGGTSSYCYPDPAAAAKGARPKHGDKASSRGPMSQQWHDASTGLPLMSLAGQMFYPLIAVWFMHMEQQPLL